MLVALSRADGLCWRPRATVRGTRLLHQPPTFVDILWAALAGPLRQASAASALAGIVAVVAATLATQVGGLCLWPTLGIVRALAPTRRVAKGAAIFGMMYALASAITVPLAARTSGRVPLPCFDSDGLGPRHLAFCALHRHYVVPALRDELLAVAHKLRANHPDARIHYLDAGFPFGGGFPMLPHLSHGDGRKVDLALFFEDPITRAPQHPGGSPIGYFGYVQPSEAPACPPLLLDLRWDLQPLQTLWGPLALDVDRTRALVTTLAAQPGIGKLLLEPHVQARLGTASPKIRFQGCHAARHDDHVHAQL